MDPSIEQLAKEARDSLSEYCYSECRSYCCRKGYLLLTEKEAKLITDKRLKQDKDGGYILDFDDDKAGCPRLSDFKCTIYKEEGRPKACKEFPIFIWENKMIRISPRCPAVRAGLLYPYTARFVKMGFSIVDQDEIIL